MINKKPKFKPGDLIEGIHKTEILRLVLFVDEKKENYKIYCVNSLINQKIIVNLSFVYTEKMYKKAK